MSKEDVCFQRRCFRSRTMSLPRSKTPRGGAASPAPRYEQLDVTVAYQGPPYIISTHLSSKFPHFELASTFFIPIYYDHLSLSYRCPICSHKSYGRVSQSPGPEGKPPASDGSFWEKVTFSMIFVLISDGSFWEKVQLRHHFNF